VKDDIALKSLTVLLPVHVFFPSHFYGTETYTLELATQLMKMGHRPVVLTATPFGEKGAGELRSLYRYKDVPVHCIDLNLLPHHRFKDTYYRPELADLLRTVITEIQPDIAHVTHLINHTAVLLEVLRDIPIPVVATLTDFFGICLNNKLERYDGILCRGPDRLSVNCLACYLKAGGINPIKKYSAAIAGRRPGLLRLMAFSLFVMTRLPGFRRGRLAGHVCDVTHRQRTLHRLYDTYRTMIAPTDFLYEAYSQNGFYPDRLRKINFGIDLSRISPSVAPRVKTDNHVRFGYIGQIARHKGTDLLIEAFRRLPGNRGSLIIYGPADQDPSYMEELMSMSAGDGRIEFRGTFPSAELIDRLSEMDCLVIPSRWYENSPLVLLYALATHTPVVVTDVKGMSEFVVNDVNGYTFKKDSVESLRFVMEKIVRDPGVIKRLSAKACYTKDVSDHAAEVLDIYNTILSPSADGAD